MSKSQHVPNTIPVLTLLAALMFTISAQPGGSNAKTSSTDLLSVSCESDSSSREIGGTCTVEGSAEGEITYTKMEPRANSADVTYKAEGTIKITEADSETEAAKSGDLKLDISRSGFASVEEVESYIAKQVKALNKKAEKKRAEAEKQAKVDECLFDEEKNKTFTEGSNAQATCLLNRVNKLSGDEAVDFFDEKVKSRMTQLLNSNNEYYRRQALSQVTSFLKQRQATCTLPNTQNIAMQIQNKSFNEITPKEYINQSACDMVHYGQYNMSLQQLSQIYPTLSPQQQQVLLSQTNQFRSGWDQYFAQRGLAINLTADAAKNPFSASQTSYLNGLNSVLTNNLNAITQAHAGLLQKETQAQLGVQSAANKATPSVIDPSGTADQVFDGRPVIGTDGLVSGVNGVAGGDAVRGVVQPPPNLPTQIPAMPSPAGGRAPKAGTR